MKGQIVIVTGAGGGGSGRAIARRFAGAGAMVVVADIDVPGGLETQKLIEADGGIATFVRVDMAVEKEVRDLIDLADRDLQGLDVLVNNASFPYHPGAKFEHWTETLQVDLIGPVQATLACHDPMQRRGGGAIVNISSVSAIGHGRRHAEVPAFDVAKAGLIRLTTALGFLGERGGIRVNCLVPGWIASAEVQTYVDSLSPEQRRARGVPETLLTTGQIADAVFRLATDKTLSGRVMVWWNDEPAGLIPVGDRGYEKLEPISIAGSARLPDGCRTS